MKFLQYQETIQYDLKMCNKLYARNPNIVIYGTETTFFLSPEVWALIPSNIIDLAPCYVFKKAIKNGNPTAHAVYAKRFCNMLDLCRVH